MKDDKNKEVKVENTNIFMNVFNILKAMLFYSGKKPRNKSKSDI